MSLVGTAREPHFFVPRADITSSSDSVLSVFDIPSHAAGVSVTDASATRIAAVWACVRLIAGSIAILPIDTYLERDGSRAPAPKNDLWWMLNEEPGPRWTAVSMWEWVARSMLLRGDGFVRVHRRSSRDAAVSDLEPLHSDRVEVVLLKSRRLAYRYTDDFDREVTVDQDDMLHFTGFGYDGRRGVSAVRHYARDAIGTAMATDQFAAKFFGSGAMQKHVVRTPGRLGPEAIKTLRDQWMERYAGLDNAYRPMVLTEGLDVKELSLSAEDSQLLESRKFNVIDIARAFGVPPILIAESEKTSSWGSGVEQIILAFVLFTLQPHLDRWEEELNRKLFRRAGRGCEFNLDRLKAGDTKARGEFLRQLVGGAQGPGVISVNEARNREGLPPIDGADELYDPRKVGSIDAPK